MRQCIVIILILTNIYQVSAQERPFRNEIRAFKHQDSIAMPPKKAILFVGSSSIRMWKTLNEDFPNHIVINRGFGGAGLPHVIAYADEIIFPYKPKQIVIYCGENDFYQAENVTADQVADRFRQLFSMIREKLPKTHIAFISLKPSPSRQEKMQEMARANSLIEEFLKEQKRVAFINIYDDMLDTGGSPRKELFIEDNLHMNASGYALWRSEVAPNLQKTRKPKSPAKP